MWLAHRHGKLGLDDGARRALRRVLATREDPLTALVLGRVAYLESARVVDVLIRQSMAVSGPPRVGDLGELLESRPWPKLHDQERRVEPDWLFVFERAVVAIEAKWGDSQHAIQLDKEYRAVRARPEARDREVILVALGRERSGPRALSEITRVAGSTRWERKNSIDDLGLGRGEWGAVYDFYDLAYAESLVARRQGESRRTRFIQLWRTS